MVLAIALLTSLVWQVRSGWPEVDVAHDRSAREWATQRLQDVPNEAVVHVQADDQLFTLWYLQGVEGLRPDVVVVDDRLLATPWFCHQLGRQHPDVRNCGLGRADPAAAFRTGGPIRIESLGTVTAAAGGDDMP
ncbi:MAG TPA: hypothetical protein VFB50_01365, partial [Chloroflexota bacterium]|nr:hypothetical protein [Chloroflexota bacterium]